MNVAVEVRTRIILLPGRAPTPGGLRRGPALPRTCQPGHRRSLLGRARIAGVLGGAGIRCSTRVRGRARVAAGLLGRARVRSSRARIATGLLGGARIARCRARVAAGQPYRAGRKRRACLPGGDRIGESVRSGSGGLVRNTCRGQSAGAHRDPQGHRGCTGNQGMRLRCHDVLRPWGRQRRPLSSADRKRDATEQPYAWESGPWGELRVTGRHVIVNHRGGLLKRRRSRHGRYWNGKRPRRDPGAWIARTQTQRSMRP
jgi:hypothetical protein